MTSRYEGRELLRRDLRQPADYFANPSLGRTQTYVPPAEAMNAEARSGC
jgi:hypothetical protein